MKKCDVCDVCEGTGYVLMDLGFGDYGQPPQYVPCDKCRTKTMAALAGVSEPVAYVKTVESELIAKDEEKRKAIKSLQEQIHILRTRLDHQFDWMASVISQITRLSRAADIEWEKDK